MGPWLVLTLTIVLVDALLRPTCWRIVGELGFFHDRFNLSHRSVVPDLKCLRLFVVLCHKSLKSPSNFSIDWDENCL